jgi:hypothetical protein
LTASSFCILGRSRIGFRKGGRAMKGVKFDCACYSAGLGIISEYFIAPKELLAEFGIKKPEGTVSAEICMEFPK